MDDVLVCTSEHVETVDSYESQKDVIRSSKSRSRAQKPYERFIGKEGYYVSDEEKASSEDEQTSGLSEVGFRPVLGIKVYSCPHCSHEDNSLFDRLADDPV